jgi:large subunit ribosomal protein L15
LRELDQLAARLVREGLAKRVRGKVKIDLAELGYDKLLGTGRVTQPLDVKVPTFTQRAVQKVEQVGGQVKRP